MIYRIYTKRLLEMLELFPVVAVIGPRQVGRSRRSCRCTCLRHDFTIFALTTAWKSTV